MLGFYLLYSVNLLMKLLTGKSIDFILKMSSITVFVKNIIRGGQNMKKRIALILVLVFLVAILTSCGNDDELKASAG